MLYGLNCFVVVLEHRGNHSVIAIGDVSLWWWNYGLCWSRMIWLNLGSWIEDKWYIFWVV